MKPRTKRGGMKFGEIAAWVVCTTDHSRIFKELLKPKPDQKILDEAGIISADVAEMMDLIRTSDGIKEALSNVQQAFAAVLGPIYEPPPCPDSKKLRAISGLVSTRASRGRAKGRKA